MNLAYHPQALGKGLVAQLNGGGVIVWVSGELDSIPSQHSGSSGYDLLRTCLGEPEDSVEAIDLLNDLLTGRVPIQHLEAWIPAPHEGRWLQITAAHVPIHEKRGAILCVTDITADKMSVKALQSHADRLRAILNHEPECVKTVDLEGNLVEMNPAGLHLIEAGSLAEVQGKPVIDLVHPDDRDLYQMLAEECRAGRASHGVFRIISLKGKIRWMETNSVPLRNESGAVNQVLSVTRDVTAQRDSEESLRSSAERYEKQRQALVSLMRSGVLQTAAMEQALKDITTTISGCMGVGRVSVWRFSQTRHSIVCMNLFDTTSGQHSSGQELHREDFPGYFHSLEQDEMIAASDAHADPRTREFSPCYLGPLNIGAMLDTPLHVGGSLVGVLCHEHIGGPRTWTEDEQSFAISLANLVSLVFAQLEHRQAEQRLRQQASLLDLTRDAILVRDLDHTITYWNKSAERLYGWTAEEAVGSKISCLLYGDDEQNQESTSEVLKNGEHVCEIRQITKSGEEVVVEGHRTLVRDAEGHPTSILAINTDVTAKKKAEEQMLRAHRLEGIGTLAGGIAHDLNNVLTPILVSIDMLKQHMEDPASLQTLGTIAASARRGAEMIRQLLTYARGMEGGSQRVELHTLLQEIAGIARDSFPKNIRLNLREEAGLWPVQGDPTQLHQMLLNLCVNARDAMPAGGGMFVEAQNAQIDATYAANHLDAHPGPHVVVSVRDEGVGIPRENLDKIFDPFFTTKEIGKGTGLGLSTTLAIVKSHGGFIEIDSTPDQGTCFRVHLPAVPSSEPEPVQLADADLPRGSLQTVLFVDDESSVREVTSKTLESFGYRVVMASNGADAVALYAQHQQTIDIVLTDMMMPVMDGVSTIQVLRKIDPEVKIIATSGVSSHGGASRAKSCGIQHFLPKPYDTGTILRALKQVLAASSDA
jgi:PAS domain S-box-containing protein